MHTSLCQLTPRCDARFFTRNRFISNLLLGSLKFKKLLELQVLFYKKPLYKQPSTMQSKI